MLHVQRFSAGTRCYTPRLHTPTRALWPNGFSFLWPQFADQISVFVPKNQSTQTLPKMIDQLATQKKFTLVADGHTFNYLESDGYVFLVVADEAFGRQAPFACLDKIAAEFTQNYGDRARDAIAHSLNRSFAPVLKQQMDLVSNNPGEVSKVSRVQQQVSEVKEIMMDNIEKVLDRGEKIELLVDKTENLRFQADNFHRTGRALRRRMWWQNLKMKLVFASFVVIVILILFLSFCYSNGNDCTKKEE
ncbi:synaptobrevin family protein [bacterium]|nr:synaptobrevin family protein [bacterium]